MTAAPRQEAIVAIRRALLSVSDKSGLVPFARALASRGVALVSTGGSARALAEAGLPVTEVAAVTGFPEMLDGRVKTLHPAIHGGLLARRDRPDHLGALARARHRARSTCWSCNLYPFAETVAAGAGREECIENIDIGGPALIRAAAKNHEFVAVVTDPADYDAVLGEIGDCRRRRRSTLRRRLARKAYALTAAYDAAISLWFAKDEGVTFPETLVGAAALVERTRYGENPHQRAAFYRTGEPRPGVATRAATAGQGAVLQQLRRYRRRLRAGRRVRRAGGGDHQARQPVRRRDRRQPARGVGAKRWPAIRSAPSAASSR